MATNLPTQIVLDDGDLMEYEVNPIRLMKANQNNPKRPYYAIHNVARPLPSTLVIGSFSTASNVQPVEPTAFGEDAPGSLLGINYFCFFSFSFSISFSWFCFLVFLGCFVMMLWYTQAQPSSCPSTSFLIEFGGELAG